MTQRSITLGALAALFVLLTAGAASAQAGIVFEFGKHKKHSHVGVGIGIPLPGPTHHHVHTHYCRRYVPGHYDIVREQVWVPGCTRESPHLYSYRRTPVTGRFAGVVVRSAG